LDVPVGIVNCSYGGSRVESWTPRDMLEGYSDVSLDPADMEAMTDYLRPMLMYNAMFRPIERYTYKGIIWYQGCSNVGQHENYPVRLAAMVERWREEMGLGEIPFYYVEIAPYDYESGDYASGARLREAQFKAQALIPNSGMVSTNDLAEPFELHNIHPRRKAPVGQRLSYMALNRTYGHDNVCDSGPEYAGWKAKGREAWVAFKNLPMGICRNYMLEGFELAGPDRVFHPATGWLHWQTNEVVLTADGVDEPVAVRYGFGDFKPGTLIGGNEQPAVPFRTDDG
ncbi:MAG: sialate O-acetylesterase, partial [Muribaculaceae bacterium]|nr:sialate O-acetylesterase [Muribaculaceae bacterium]